MLNHLLKKCERFWVEQMRDYLQEMLIRHQSWFKEGGFTAEIASFEYMKRNPYFIETVYFFNQQIKELRSDESRRDELRFILDKMKITLKRLFLYSGSDVLSSNNISSGGFTFIHNEIESSIYDLKNSGFPNDDYHYSYSDIYELDTYKQPGISAEDYKRQHTLDMDMLLDNRSSERWLNHLRPSLYLKINPNHSQDTLKLDVLAALKKIEQEIPEYATPEILINEYAELENSFITSNKFRPKSSAVALIMYDLKNIIQVPSASIIQDILQGEFEKEYETFKFNQYFTQINQGNDEYAPGFELKIMEKKMTEVIKRINGGYLDYVYSNNAQRAHFDLLSQRFMDHFRVNYTDEHVSMLKTHENIKDKLEHLILHVNNFTDNECLNWSQLLYSDQKIPKNDLYQIILM